MDLLIDQEVWKKIQIAKDNCIDEILVNNWESMREDPSSKEFAISVTKDLVHPFIKEVDLPEFI